MKSVLIRPELAVLLSSTKLVLQSALEASTVPDDLLLEAQLLGAFPVPMRVKFKRDIHGHRLRREIVATKLANRIVNRLGPIHPFELAEEAGATLAQVSSAFIAAEALLGMAAVWELLETAAMPEPARIALFDRAAAAMTNHMADLLRAGGGSTRPSQLIAELGSGVGELLRDSEQLLSSEGSAQSARLRADFAAAGAPAQAADAVVHLFDVDGAIGLARLARQTGIAARILTRGFTDIGARLGLDWAQQCAERTSPADPWERLLANGLARDFQHMRFDFLRQHCGKKGDPAAAVERWAEAQAPAIRQFRLMLSRAQNAMAVTPAMLAQIASQARNLLAR
jgi:glutamate dehydrogenase